MITQPATQRCIYETGSNCMIQLGIEVSQTKFVEPVINFLNKHVFGLHLQLKLQSRDTGILQYTNDDPPIFQVTPLPVTHKNHLQQISESFISDHYVNPSIRLGSIGYTNNFIVLNLSHSVGDGGYFRFIIEQLNKFLHNEKSPFWDKKIPYFQREPVDIFRNDLKNAPQSDFSWWNKPKVNRVYSNTKSINPSFDLKTNCEYVTKRIDSSNLACFYPIPNSPKKGRLHGLTNSFWTSIYLASSIHNLSLPKPIGIEDHISMPTVVDLRRYMNISEIGFDVGNNFSNVIPYASVSLEEKLSCIGQRMKNNMFELMKKKNDIYTLKSFDNILNAPKKSKPPPGCSVELTYVGPIHIKEPIVDIWCGHSMNVRSSAISMMGFSIVNDNIGRNELVTRLRYSPPYFDDSEAKNMANVIDFCLKNIEDTMTVNQALEEAASYAKTIND